MPTLRLPMLLSLALSLSAFLPFFPTVITAAESEAAEAATIALAAKPGPSRGKALADLGREKPINVPKVVAVLVDAVVSKDVGAQITAQQALDSLSSFPEHRPEARLVCDALNPHGERLLAAASTQMTELTNSPIEALSMLSRPASTLVPGLLKLLAPGAKFRSHSATTLAKCRPLTPEIRRAVLAEIDGHPLAQQNIAFVLRTWSAEELAGDDIDQALTRLQDSIMGNVPPIALDVAKKRGQPCPQMLARLRELIDYPAVPDSTYSYALRSFAELADMATVQALAERLLVQDPKKDPDHYERSLVLIRDGRALPAAVQAHLLQLANDPSLDLYLRRAVANALTEGRGSAETPPLVKELAKHLFWPNSVYDAIYYQRNKPGIDERLAKAATDQEREVWTLVKPLGQAVAIHAKDANANQRLGAWAHAFLISWAQDNPAQAWEPHVVYLTLRAYLLNYAQTEAEKAQMLTYITTLMQREVFSAPALRAAEFPAGGAGELRSSVYEALSMALRATVKTKEKGQEFQTEVIFAPLRRLREAKAPELLLLYAERQLASSIRTAIRDRPIDPEIFRKPLTDCGFSLVPIDVLLAEAARPLQTKR